MKSVRLPIVFQFLIVAVVAGTSIASGATYAVTTTRDSIAGSLRQAMNDANSHAGPDTIAFNIPTSDPGYSAVSGVWTIRPLSALPDLNDNGTALNGTTQTVNRGNTNLLGPEIEIDGTQAGATSCLKVFGANTLIKGIVINRFAWDGIEITGNLARGTVVVGNYIGTDATGIVARGNGFGGVFIRFGPRNTTIGGPTEAERNIISGATTSVNLATGNGVYIEEADSSWIIGNYIGVDRAGTAPLPNKNSGICLRDCQFTVVGGLAAGEGNIIAGNTLYGLVLRMPLARRNAILGNHIGTDVTRHVNIGNGAGGIALDYGARNNIIGPDNCIAFNGGTGISVSHDTTFAITFTRNSIRSNVGKGIFISPGGNGGVVAPTITAALPTSITGSTIPNSTVEIFSDSIDEGGRYEGSVSADGLGHFVWNGVAAGPRVTATCTDAAGNTSIFSAPVIVTGIGDRGSADVPLQCSLSQNYPNPFNPTTIIKFQIPNSNRVTLKVYDMLGREVSVLVNGRMEAGVHEVKFDGAGLSSGVYYYRFQAGEPSTGSGPRVGSSPFDGTQGLTLSDTEGSRSYVQIRKLLLLR